MRGVEVVCEVVNGGVLREQAGINLPGVDLSVSPMTAKDYVDLAFGIAQEVDYVVLSFVRRAEDMPALQSILKQASVPIAAVAKLEKPQAIEVLDDIIAVSDAVMMARGDLGVELSPERVPSVRKSIIRAAVRVGKPVITATQMLESMIENPRPTRAEASDVANVVLDGTDAVMLSGETAVGQYPVDAIQIMDRIMRKAERGLQLSPERRRRGDELPLSFPDAIAEAAGRVAADTQAAAIVAFTQSGFTARQTSKHRPARPIFAFTTRTHVLRRLCLNWGVSPCYAGFVTYTDEMVARVARGGTGAAGRQLSDPRRHTANPAGYDQSFAFAQSWELS